MNRRRAKAALRQLAAAEEEAARLAQERATAVRELAEAIEDPDDPPTKVERRGRGCMLQRPRATRPPSEVDQKRARKALGG
jgi:hypothetical protein